MDRCVARLGRLVLALPLALAACAADTADDVPEGYVRFEPEPILVQPGESGQWVQYVAAPIDQDLDVVDIIGEQGPGGHHAVLYATLTDAPVGTTREWSQVDQVADRFLGGLGGEGAEEIALPDGAVFRIPAGHALYINTHYFNATPSPIEAWSRLDVKLEPASPSRVAVSLFANTDLAISVPSGAPSSVEVGCTVEDDLELVMYANHMHEWGVATQTTLVADGVEQMLKDDPVWEEEWATNPNFARHALAAPMRIPAGSTLTTTCSWDNDTGRTLTFPDEMCLFLAFHTGPTDVTCVAGSWSAGVR